MGLASDFPSVHTVRSSVEFSTWFRCSTTGERRSPPRPSRPPDATMISPIDARKVGGNCRPKFALALVVALLCAVAEASRYKSYEPEPSYGGHYEEEDYGSDYHKPTEYEVSHYGDNYGDDGYGYEHKSYDHEPDYGSYEDHDSYETIGGGYKGSHYEQEYQHEPSYGGQDYKKSYRHKRAVIPLVMPRRKLEEGIALIEGMRETVVKLKTDTATDAVALLNKQIKGASDLFKKMLESLKKKTM